MATIESLHQQINILNKFWSTLKSQIRKSGIDNEIVNQANCNIDRLDGTKNNLNKFGILADFSKSQILVIDYQNYDATDSQILAII